MSSEQEKNEEIEADFKEEIKRELEKDLSEEHVPLNEELAIVVPEEVAVELVAELSDAAGKEKIPQEEPKKEAATEEKSQTDKEPSEEVLNNPAKDLSKKRQKEESDKPKKEKKLVQQPLRASVARVLTWIGTVLAVLLGTLAMLIGRSVFWVLKTWNNLSMEELIFHIQAPLEGTNEGMVKEYILSCGIISIVVFIVLIAAFVILRKKRNIYYSTMMSVLLVSILSTVLCLRHIWNELDISSYRSNQSTYSTFIDDNYVNPKDVSIQFPEKKRNLIYIYLESIENTYADKESGGAFDENVIPELTELSNKYENFSGDHETLNGGYSMTGTTWTIGAMFGQTSGLPLTIPIERNNMSSQETFFPEIVTLGDILEEQGYSQNLMIGSDAVFGGRQLYFQEHGNYNIYDYNYSIKNGEMPAGYYVWWGYEDRFLLDIAKKRLTELGSSDEPFNLTLLTVDTHFEDGFVCEDCENLFGDNQYANVMQCSSKKVTEFVEWIQQQDFYENTTIVISGDHPTMDADFCEDIDEDYTRKVYTTYINAPITPENNSYREYTTFDDFPTTLASLGAVIEGNRLGLGTNLFSNTQTLSERFGYEKEDKEIARKSKLMEKLTSDIQEEEEPEEEHTGRYVTADVNVTPYDFMEGKFTVNITNIDSNFDMLAIRCAIWSDDAPEDLVWYEAQPGEDGSYITDVFASDLGYKQSAYHVDVYAIDILGQPILINGLMGAIE